MTRDDIIRMAREAAEYADTHTEDVEPNDDEWSALRDKRFAELVRADEREACAKVCEDKNTLLAWPTYAAAIRARGQA
jgi:hypothetical protein